MGGIDDLPAGLFRTLLEFWETLRVTYYGVLEVVTSFAVSIPGSDTELSLFTVMFGGGLIFYISYVVIKWLIGLIT